MAELYKLLRENGFNVEFYGAFSTSPNGLKDEAIATIKRIAVALHLIPKTMKGKEFLKRMKENWGRVHIYCDLNLLNHGKTRSPDYCQYPIPNN